MPPFKTLEKAEVKQSLLTWQENWYWLLKSIVWIEIKLSLVHFWTFFQRISSCHCTSSIDIHQHQLLLYCTAYYIQLIEQVISRPRMPSRKCKRCYLSETVQLTRLRGQRCSIYKQTVITGNLCEPCLSWILPARSPAGPVIQPVSHLCYWIVKIVCTMTV